MFFKKILKIGLWSFFLLLVGAAIFFADAGFKTKKTVAAGEKLFRTINDNKTQSFEKDFLSWQNDFFSLKKRILEINQIFGNYLEKKYQIKKYLDLVEEITALIPKIVAKGGAKTYYILLQNDRELRPSGGFMGSYAKLKFKDAGLAEVIFQDIYVPDGQIVGHVEPPWPIQEAFKQGWWKLRDSNWDPDFPSSAKVIDWFFQKGGEEKADGIIAVNFSVVQKLLKILGSFYLPDYNQAVDEDNLYQLAQSYSEIDFFPGSTQKKDIISGLGKALLAKFKGLEQEQLVKILPLLYQNLEERQILVSLVDPSLATAFKKLDWDGSMKILQLSDARVLNDYLYLVETNLGANKANCCLERKVSQEVDLSDGQVLKEKVVINFKNTGQFKEGIPPFFLGGTYNNFQRIYFPISGRMIKVMVGGKEVPTEKILAEKKEDLNLQSIGFFVKVSAQSEETVEIDYEVSLIHRERNPSETPMDVGVKGDDIPLAYLPANYNLILQKQPGIESFPYTLVLKTPRETNKIEKEVRKEEEIFIVLYKR